MKAIGQLGRWAIVALVLAISQPALAQQTMIPDYATARDQFFWTKLYDGGGQTLYCTAIFPAGERTRAENGERLSVEHA